MKKLILIWMIIILSLMVSVSAICTITFDKESYNRGETATAEMVCTEATEKLKSYTLTWVNETNITLETDGGTTPSTAGEHFLESYTIPVDYPVGVYINATLTGTNLEGYDDANVTAPSASDIILSSSLVAGKWLGISSSLTSIAEVSNKSITGGYCRISIWSNDATQMLGSAETRMINGEVKTEWVLGYGAFEEGTDYIAKVICYCGSNASNQECINEDGNSVENAIGSANVPFTTNTWLTFNDNTTPIVNSSGTEINASLFAGFDTVYWRNNISNNFGENLKGTVTNFLIHNESNKVYKEEEEIATLGLGNRTKIGSMELPKNPPTGVYKIRQFVDVFYNNIEVAQYIVESDTFNLTGIKDTMTINSITIKDYWGVTVNTSAGLLSDSSMPTSNWTLPYTTLTEGFGYQICGNITNSYSDDIYWHMENLIIHNPTTGWSNEEFHRYTNGNQWQRVLTSGDSDICWYSNIPLTIPTHSDYHFDFNIHIGDEHAPFVCGVNCDFSGETDYMYIGAIEDSIVLSKWYTEPNSSQQGVPLIMIVTERDEVLSMNDDCNYTNQVETDWNNASFPCNPKDGGSQMILNLSVYPRAGEKFKVCFQAQNYLSAEVDLEFFDIYIDSDASESMFEFFEQSDGYVPSIQDDKLWESETPSRALELQGTLIDGYGIMCSKWLRLPSDTHGGNNWDIQGKVRINPDIYNLKEDIVWNWESDEFPIYGTRENESFTRLVDITNVGTSAYATNVTACTDIEVNITYNYFGYEEENFRVEYCIEQTDSDDIEICYDRLINPDVGTGNVITDVVSLPYFESNGSAEIFIHIHTHEGEEEIMVGYGDTEPYNTFDVLTDYSDSCKYSSRVLEYRSVAALEGINSSAGTFDFKLTVPDTSMSTVVIAGSGLTGDGRILNRDLLIKCQVDGYPSTASEFPIFATDTFSFTKTMSVPPLLGTYTMRCTAIDRFMGEDAVQATDNFRVTISLGRVGADALPGLEEEREIDDGSKLILAFIIIFVCMIIFGKKEEEEDKEDEEEK